MWAIAIDRVRLDIADSAGRTDYVIKDINVTLPLPEYREVSPTGRQDNFLTRLSNVFFGF